MAILLSRTISFDRTTYSLFVVESFIFYVLSPHCSNVTVTGFTRRSAGVNSFHYTEYIYQYFDDIPKFVTTSKRKTSLAGTLFTSVTQTI